MPSAGCEFFRFLSRFVFLTPSGFSGRKELEVFSGLSIFKPPNPNSLSFQTALAVRNLLLSLFLPTTKDQQPTTALLHNLRDRACAYRVSAFADSEAQPFLHRHRCDQLNH